MQLGLTLPLKRHLKIKSLNEGPPVSRHFCWDLHVIALRGRGSLLAVHCETRYAFTVFDMSAADWQALPETFLRGLKTSLYDAGIPGDAVGRYIQAGGGIVLTKTHGRREVAFLNRAWENVLTADMALDPARQHQPLLDGGVNNRLCHCAGYEGAGAAVKRLRHALQEGQFL